MRFIFINCFRLLFIFSLTSHLITFNWQRLATYTLMFQWFFCLKSVHLAQMFLLLIAFHFYNITKWIHWFHCTNSFWINQMCLYSFCGIVKFFLSCVQIFGLQILEFSIWNNIICNNINSILVVSMECVFRHKLIMQTTYHFMLFLLFCYEKLNTQTHIFTLLYFVESMRFYYYSH